MLAGTLPKGTAMRHARYEITKPVAELTEDDLRRSPIWEYGTGNESKPGRDETWVRPVRRLPVRSLANRMAWTPIRLANGTATYGLVGNISLRHPRQTRNFIVITFFKDGRSFTFSHARPKGASGLAHHLGLRQKDIFPLSYDLSGLAIGLHEVVRGTVSAKPPEALTDVQRMELIFEDDN